MLESVLVVLKFSWCHFVIPITSCFGGCDWDWTNDLRVMSTLLLTTELHTHWESVLMGIWQPFLPRYRSSGDPSSLSTSPYWVIVTTPNNTNYGYDIKGSTALAIGLSSRMGNLVVHHPFGFDYLFTAAPMPIVSELLCCNLADYSSPRQQPRMPSSHGSQDGRRGGFCMGVVHALPATSAWRCHWDLSRLAHALVGLFHWWAFW